MSKILSPFLFFNNIYNFTIIIRVQFPCNFKKIDRKLKFRPVRMYFIIII